MQWRSRLAVLLGAASPFALSSGHEALALPADTTLTASPPKMERDAWTYVDPAERERIIHLAGHRSHSSHSSHSSHYSGSSGGGHSSHYSGSTPAPLFSPPPAPPPPPRPRPRFPPPAAPATLYTDPPAGKSDGDEPTRFSQGQTKDYVQKVQIALLMKGYDPGPADGQLGSKTQEALKAFQKANGLPATGYMDVATLRLLGVIN